MNDDMEFIRVQRSTVGNRMFTPSVTAYLNVLDIAGFELDYEHTYNQTADVRVRVVSSRYPNQFFFIDIPRNREQDNDIVLKSWIWAMFDDVINDPDWFSVERCGSTHESGDDCELRLHHLTYHMGRRGRIWEDEQPALIADEAREVLLSEGITVP